MPFSTKQKFAEFYRISFEESQEGLWLAVLDEPLSVSLPMDRQQEHLFKHAYLAECNKAFTAMYGYSDPAELVGARFPQLLILSDPENLKAVRTFLVSGYQVKNVQTHELAKNGEEKYFLNDVRGIVEEDFLVRFWGKQKDVTSDRLRAHNNLTPQQATILKLTIEGKSLKEISHVLGVSLKSVDTIRARLKRKLGASNIPHLAARAVQLGLFDLADKL
jgi:DNA-binding CsgD family transcriptional regulator